MNEVVFFNDLMRKTKRPPCDDCRNRVCQNASIYKSGQVSCGRSLDRSVSKPLLRDFVGKVVPGLLLLFPLLLCSVSRERF